MIDLLPAQTERWQKVESVVRGHFLRTGFKEIRTPLLESTNLFSRSIGEYTDVVGKEMYSFCDRGDRSCTLRPEGTASVVRSVLEHGLLSQGPQRFWYGGPMFRYERPQNGRQRQFHQIGVECFGIDSPLVDVDIISIAWDIFKDLGIVDLELQLNSLGTEEDMKNYKSLLVGWLEDRFDHLDIDSQRRLKSNPLRILDSKNSNTQMLLEDSPSLLESLSSESIERFQYIQNTLKSLEIPFVLNTKLVRGLDYYCHTAFEIVSKQLGSQSTLCGGGRYDRLIQQLQGPPTPAIGWAMGMERLMILLEDLIRPVSNPEVYVISRGDKAKRQALIVSRLIRHKNISVEIDYSQSAFSKQFKKASKISARWAIVIGEDEIKNNYYRLKKLQSANNIKGEEEINVEFSDLNNLIDILRD
tara:strand:+ start:8875 stop:10119 length:1245 start_codon:yes stop_codon:yes gene_type:complete